MPEETFVAGVDPGLHSWAHARQCLRNARAEGKDFETIASGIAWNNRRYWNDKLYDEFILPPITVQQQQQQQHLDNNVNINDSNDSNDVSICCNFSSVKKVSLKEFENALFHKQISAKELLIIAFHQRHFRFLDIVIYAGCISVNLHVDDMNRTLLHHACMNGEYKKVVYLLNAGANTRLKDVKQYTPLMLSINKPDFFHPIKIPRLLIAYGAEVNAIDSRQMSALHKACLLKDLRLIELLLKKNAHVYIFDTNNRMPIQYGGSSTSDIIEVYKKNCVGYCGKWQHNRMWSHLTAREIVKNIFSMCQPSCALCKKKYSKCALLKVENYRKWLLLHNRRLG